MKRLQNCAGCGEAMLAEPAPANHVNVCLACFWDPDRAVYLTPAMVDDLRKMQDERRAKSMPTLISVRGTRLQHIGDKK